MSTATSANNIPIPTNTTTTTTIKPSQKAFVLVTGASRGIGQAIALELARHFVADACILLCARHLVALNVTRDLIRHELGDRHHVHSVPLNLTEPATDQLTEIFSAYDARDFDVALIVHNVGTVGDIKLGADACFDASIWHEYYATNVFSVARLNVHFLEHFAPVATTTGAAGKQTPRCAAFVVNVTSKCALVPYPSFTFYCTSRAAREMYFNVLAAERSDVRVLHYSPGVVDTAMTVDVQSRSASATLRDSFRAMRTADQMLRPAQTAAQLVRVLCGGDYKSGDRVDYYDVADGNTKAPQQLAKK